ncbi:alpha/beta hydrolase [Microbacterium sp. C7(2022)]|uniref:alpha/beta hydrolase n=1 Tax=Microbacterium sp. C7(2022) TaxID=2992759 RepID=UPI00237A1653|nr:alpha/beta hydrolase [Microbacterium sp. C7(2022)]MDE0546633.1 alpha/beta hydrolase [Microbacterium sp. C7(2022)]
MSNTPRDAWQWITASLGALAIVVVAWACLTSWGGVVHGHPAYAVLLGVTAVGGVAAIWLSLRRRKRARRSGAWRVTGRIALIALGLAWIAVTAWLRPYSAIEPALPAMQSDGVATVTETGTQIVIEPTGGADATAVFFQPGALVDPRAYAAVLRPLAEAGHRVVITKQPFGIAFFALGAFDATRTQYGDVNGWVIGGHSLGGTVAAIQADGADGNGGGSDTDAAPAVGLLFFASYPAGDISDTLVVPVESISGSRDGLATPEKIDASRADLPADTNFTVIEGGSHAQFGDYGPQVGDNEPEISDDDARGQISAASVAFVDALVD